MVTSVPPATAVPSDQRASCPASRALTVLRPERPAVSAAPEEPCAPLRGPSSRPCAPLVKLLKFYLQSWSEKHPHLGALSSQGHLCPAGTALPEPCPSGTFSNNTGAHNLSVCTPCPSGRYCHSAGTTIPQGTEAHHYFTALSRHLV